MAITNVLFISENELKNNNIVQQNVDSNLISPFIKTAQDIYIEPFLGTVLTQQLKDKITNNQITNEWEELLIRYIAPAHVQYAMYESMPFNVAKWTNKSITYKSSENSQPLDLTDIKELRKMVLNTAELYMEKLKCYLEENPTLFPNFGVRNNCCDGATDTFFCGIEF